MIAFGKIHKTNTLATRNSFSGMLFSESQMMSYPHGSTWERWMFRVCNWRTAYNRMSIENCHFPIAQPNFGHGSHIAVQIFGEDVQQSEGKPLEPLYYHLQCMRTISFAQTFPLREGKKNRKRINNTFIWDKIPTFDVPAWARWMWLWNDGAGGLTRTSSPFGSRSW